MTLAQERSKEMRRMLILLIFLAGLSSGQVSPAVALETVKLGTSIRMSPTYYLPPTAAEERGFWKENGLAVEWVPFRGTAPHVRALAAGAINIGMASAADSITAAERGLPLIIVAQLFGQTQFRVWVRADSPYRHVRDLKGKRISVTALGAATHIFGRVMLAAHGLEKEVRFVGTGGTPEQLASLMAGGVDAAVEGLFAWTKPYLEGKIREIGSPVEYLPKPWVGIVAFARRDFIASKAEVVRKMTKAMLQSIEFMRKNPRWTKDKIKSFQGLSEEAATLVYDWIDFSTAGKIERKGLENLRSFFIQYGILTDKAPAVDELFTNEYLPET